MIREQDNTLDSIAGTLTNLAQQAGLMGREIGEHNELRSYLTPSCLVSFSFVNFELTFCGYCV